MTKFQISTTVFLIRTIQTVLVSITHIGVVNTAMVRTQEEIRRACCDSGICQCQTLVYHFVIIDYHVYVCKVVNKVFDEVKVTECGE